MNDEPERFYATYPHRFGDGRLHRIDCVYAKDNHGVSGTLEELASDPYLSRDLQPCHVCMVPKSAARQLRLAL